MKLESGRVKILDSFQLLVQNKIILRHDKIAILSY